MCFVFLLYVYLPKCVTYILLNIYLVRQFMRIESNLYTYDFVVRYNIYHCTLNVSLIIYWYIIKYFVNYNVNSKLKRIYTFKYLLTNVMILF